MATEKKTIALVVGHKEKDARQHLGGFFKLLIEGQDFNRTKLTRVYSAVVPSPGMRVWWERLRSQTEDRQIHTLR